MVTVDLVEKVVGRQQHPDVRREKLSVLLAEFAAERFLTACVEILNGHRPASHLRAVVDPSQVANVTNQLVRRTKRTYLAAQELCVDNSHHVRLQRLRTSELRDGVAEVAAVMSYGVRTWAVAARLERRTDIWQCTLLQVL